jgi:hypothetical protein
MNLATREWLVRAAFAITALVHLLPVAGLLGRPSLERAYGVALGQGQDLVVLMQHRALLFGLISAACFFAILSPPWRLPAGIAALVSMLGFVLIAALQPHNAAIARVMWVDIGVALLLGAGLWMHVSASSPQ